MFEKNLLENELRYCELVYISVLPTQNPNFQIGQFYYVYKFKEESNGKIPMISIKRENNFTEMFASKKPFIRNKENPGYKFQ